MFYLLYPMYVNHNLRINIEFLINNQPQHNLKNVMLI